jgi:soluble lytic murein transglycosylase-like protein
MQRARDEAAVPEHVTANQQPEAEHDSKLSFAAAGPIPPVTEMGQMAMLSPSERAYGSHDELSANGQIMQHEAELDGKAIETASRRYNIPEVDILAIITHESRGVATANAGARQKDHGSHAASGLMQVTHETWKATQESHPELRQYPFEKYRYVRHINILVGTAALSDKRDALARLGIPADSSNIAALTTMAYNAGEGIVSDAYERAVRAGAAHPDVACLGAEYLKPAIAKYPSVYKYYLTGGGKSRNPQRSVQKAIDLKYNEISRYPHEVEMLIAEANKHELTDTSEDVPMQAQVEVAEADKSRDPTG